MPSEVLDVFRLRPVNVAGQVEVKLILFYLCPGHQPAITVHLCLSGKHIDNAVYVHLPQAILITVFYKAPTGIDDEDTVLIHCIFIVQEDNTAKDASAKKEVNGQTNNPVDSDLVAPEIDHY
jgi:hypothetical protein